jgi:bacillithiol synthase
VDPTLGGSAEATRTALLKEIEKLKGRVIKAEKRQQEQVQEQIERAQTNLFPSGKPQERVLSPLSFLNKYGPDLFTRLQKNLSLDTTEHQVLLL